MTDRWIVAGSMAFKQGSRTWVQPGPVFDHMADLTGRTGRLKLTVLNTAGGDSDEWMGRMHEAFYGTRFDVTVLKLVMMPNVADPAQLLLDSDLVWVNGGSVAALLALWKLHEIDVAMRAAWDAGVVLGGISAGSICWHIGGPTDSFGPDLRAVTNGVGLLPFGCGVHYNSEEQRRPLLHSLVGAGTLPLSYATDDGSALVYRGTSVHEAIASRPGPLAYRVELGPSGVVETPIEPRVL
jgi:peptidase E